MLHARRPLRAVFGRIHPAGEAGGDAAAEGVVSIDKDCRRAAEARGLRVLSALDQDARDLDVVAANPLKRTGESIVRELPVRARVEVEQRHLHRDASVAERRGSFPPATPRAGPLRESAAKVRRRSTTTTTYDLLGTTLRSISLFVVAAVAEIGGAWLIRQVVRDGRAWWWAARGGAALVAYGFVAAAQIDPDSGRVLAAYGGVFVAGSLLWGVVLDGLRPDRHDVAGALVRLVGVAIIVYAPREGAGRPHAPHTIGDGNREIEPSPELDLPPPPPPERIILPFEPLDRGAGGR